jgi:acetylornithine deacetylase/succinyl-diaminopimelate desuccinylase-like protein
MAARLRGAGIDDVQVFKPAPRKGNLVARLRGTGARKPILLMAHLDVVEALDEELLSTIEKTSEEFWRGVPVVPVMSAAGSDGTYLRNAGIPTYGHSGLASDVDDVRAHGKDERVGVKAFFEGGEYLYRLVKRLAGGK